MGIFQTIAPRGFESVNYFHDAGGGMRAIIAIHSTLLGPAFGGVRMVAYPTEEAALDDVLRLAEAMTRKCAIAGEAKGGAKAVIWGDPAKDKSPALLRAFGRAVESFNGRFVTGVDMGLSLDDADVVHQTTRYIVARSEKSKSWGKSGYYAARGVLASMRAALHFLDGDRSLEGRTVAVQGLGYLGGELAAMLAEAGARLVVADIVAGAVGETKKRCGDAEIRVVPPGEILSARCDLLAPCALGGVLNGKTISRLQCRAVVGGANNQLRDPARDSAALHGRKVLWVPDYLANAGGVIAGICEFEGRTREEAARRCDGLEKQVLRLLERSAREKRLPLAVAENIVEERLAAARNILI